MPKGIRKERKLPMAGMIFTRKFKDKKYSLTVIELDGKIQYELGKEIFNSPTGAAQSITKNPTNGWNFWGMKDY